MSEPARSPSSARERLNGLMGRLYRLEREVADYDRLHDAEIERLGANRRKHLGDHLKRIGRLRSGIERFAVQAYLDFGEISMKLPNGEISSRPVLAALERDDVKVFDQDWSPLLPPGTIEERPVVELKKLRAWIDAQVEAGFLQRIVYRPGVDGTDPDFELVDDEYRQEFPGPDWVGGWFWTEAGADEYNFEVGEMLEGVTWTPNGTMGSGRNFKLKV